MTDTPPTDTTPPTDELGRRRRVLQLADDVADLVHDVAERAKELHAIGVPSAEWLSVVGHRFGPRLQGILGWSVPYVAPMLDILLGMAPGEIGKPGVTALDLGVAAALKNFAAAKELSSDLRSDQPPLTIDGLTSDDLEEAVEFSTTMLRASSQPDAVIDKDVLNLASCFLAIDAGAPRVTENSQIRRMKAVIGRLFDEAPKMNNPDGTVDATQAPAMDVHILLRGAPMQFSGILSTTPEGTLKLMTPVPGPKPCMVEQFFDYSDVTSVALVREVKASVAGSRIITS